MSNMVIQTKNLTRYFGVKKVISNLNIEVPRGSIFGFLGRNGAGKSTTIRILLGLLEPTRGSSTILGYDSRTLPADMRARIGYLTEGHRIYGWMTVLECGEFQANFFPKWNPDLFHAVIKHFRLDLHTRASNLSRGQRAGLCLALTLAPEPELLILDDPALGLDPIARRSLLQSMVYVTRNSKCTVFFSSHLLSDVERVADFIAVMDQGVLRASCSVDAFRRRVRRFVLHLNSKNSLKELPQIPGLLHSFRTEKEISITIANYNEEVESVLSKMGVDRIEMVEMGLEETFIEYLGERGEKSFFFKDVDGAK
jgi:ABC-2 type transport system ATP-binding protein